MRTVDLIAELKSTTQQPAAMRWFVGKGVPRPMLTTCLGIDGMFGVSRIRIDADGTYEPAEDGIGAIVMGVIEHNELSDLLAFCTAAPSRWWRRLGLAVYLGEEKVDYAAFMKTPLRLFRTPVNWLRAECEGAVVLDWRFGRSALFDVSRIGAEDLDHREEIKRRLRDRDPILPRIIVPGRLAA